MEWKLEYLEIDPEFEQQNPGLILCQVLTGKREKMAALAARLA